MIEILGKNGAGKSYLANKLYAMGFKRSVNFTTRPKRPNEVNGIDYFFIDNAEFESLIKEGFFIEFKQRNGCYYGTPKENISPETILIAGDSSKFKHLIQDEIFPIFINSSLASRYDRVKLRNTGANDVFARFHGENFMYLGNFKGVFVDNDKNDEKSMDELLAIIDKSGKITDRSKIKSNKEMITEWVNGFDKKELSKIDDSMKAFLMYEEYIMRKASLLFDLTDRKNDKQVFDYYMQNMVAFLDEFNMQYKKLDDGFSIVFDGQEFHSDFQAESLSKIVKEKGE